MAANDGDNGGRADLSGRNTGKRTAKIGGGNSCDDIFTVGKSFSVFLFKCDVYLVEGFVLAKKRKYVYVSCIWEGIIFFVIFFKRDVDLLWKVVSEFIRKIHVTGM